VKKWDVRYIGDLQRTTPLYNGYDGHAIQFLPSIEGSNTVVTINFFKLSKQCPRDLTVHTGTQTPVRGQSV